MASATSLLPVMVERHNPARRSAMDFVEEVPLSEIFAAGHFRLAKLGSLIQFTFEGELLVGVKTDFAVHSQMRDIAIVVSGKRCGDLIDFEWTDGPCVVLDNVAHIAAVRPSYSTDGTGHTRKKGNLYQFEQKAFYMWGLIPDQTPRPIGGWVCVASKDNRFQVGAHASALNSESLVLVSQSTTLRMNHPSHIVATPDLR